MKRVPALLALLIPLASAPSRAAEWQGLHLSGFADLYATAARDAPDGRNFGGLGTAATREGELALDLVGLELRKDAEPWGFTVVLAAGDELEAMHAAEEPSARDTFRNVYQASVAYKRGRMQVEAGLFPSHIGFESALPHLNWNYTHSWVATLSPFYQTGVKLIFTPDDKTTLELHALNGWQQIADLNDGKSFGVKLARQLGPLKATLNGIYGDEPTPAGDLPRELYDLILEAPLGPRFSAALETYRGRQQREGSADGEWEATAAWLRWQAGRHAVALRGERFDDGDGAISGTAQRLESLTATWDAAVHESAKLRLELRRDRSSATFFKSGEPRRQELAVLALAFVF